MRPPFAFVAALALAAGLAACAGAPPVTPARPPANRAVYPSDVLDLSNWYLTLPTGPPKAIRTPSTSRSCARTTAVGSGWPTPGTPSPSPPTRGAPPRRAASYPRSELREMVGDAKASWSDTERHAHPHRQ